MSSRLASFHGPSTPSSSPVQKHKSQRTPSSPSSHDRPAAESPFHRKTRTLLLEIKTLTDTWDDLVVFDGLRTVKGLIDCRTELEYVRMSFLGSLSEDVSRLMARLESQLIVMIWPKIQGHGRSSSPHVCRLQKNTSWI
jgi:hypothetical protein